jgi:exopolyphosphatase / guanosine-5'-triphosphate,3'-diphosphate pyrophosphatase
MTEAPGAVAALDCGTNSTRLLIVGPEGGLVDRQMRVTRLGEGVDINRKLSSEAIERTIAVLREFRQSMDLYGVTRARMVATSAARDASNSNEFMSAAREVTGVEPEILSGQEEGRLSFRGATSDLPSEDGGGGSEELIVDIGGGSTELVAGVPGGADDAIRVLSLDIGCVRVTERFFDDDPPSVAQLTAARSAVAEELAKARLELEVRGDRDRVIGLAGTVSTLGSLSKGFESYDRDRVHHTVLSSREVGDWLDKLASEPTSARAKRPGMEPGRADVIVAGVLILSEVMSAFGRRTCLVSEADILDGIVAGLR